MPYRFDTVNQNPAKYNKLFMADMSQVYYPQNNKLTSPSSEVVTVDNNSKNSDTTSLLMKNAKSSYRPARTNKNNGRHEIAAEVAAAVSEEDPAAAAAFRRSVSPDLTEADSTSGDVKAAVGRRASTTLLANIGERRRRSSSHSRRHSSPPGSEQETSSASSASGGGVVGATLRRKCQPHHKCAAVNQSVSSIMRPSRYSYSSCMTSSSHSSVANEVSFDNAASTATAAGKKASRRRRSAESIPSSSMHSYFLPPLSNSKPSLNKSHRRPSCDSLDRWVASGVDFSSSVEVYVFRK